MFVIDYRSSDLSSRILGPHGRQEGRGHKVLVPRQVVRPLGLGIAVANIAGFARGVGGVAVGTVGAVGFVIVLHGVRDGQGFDVHFESF